MDRRLVQSPNKKASNNRAILGSYDWFGRNRKYENDAEFRLLSCSREFFSAQKKKPNKPLLKLLVRLCRWVYPKVHTRVFF
ncbi:hypothetical protein ACS0TY_016393 [Phlomoides rotata]